MDKTLVLVYAQMIQSGYGSEAVNVLAEVSCGNQTNGLEVLVRAWCDHYSDFHGFYTMKLR